LKYFSPDTNYDALARELTSGDPGHVPIDERLEEDLEKWPEFAADPFVAPDAETRTA
ncbi:MAG: hypothetical protein JWP30_1972, partial [Homoserinimonas sp.]|nr:hypothetical protein [Homoserinimonas sp.]